MEENEKFEIIMKRLNEIKDEQSSKLEDAKKQKEITSKDKDPQLYKEVEYEIERREEEFKKIEENIKKTEKLSDKTKDIKEESEKLVKELKERQEAYSKSKEYLSKTDKNKDPKTYAEGEEEVSARKKGISELEEKIEQVENQKEDQNKELNEIVEKYHIKVEKDNDNKEKIDVEKSNKNKENKDDTKTTLEEEIAAKEAELKKTADRMAEYKKAGIYDQEAAEKSRYYKLVEELSNLKSNKNKENKDAEKSNKNEENKNYTKSTSSKEEIAEYNDLISKGYTEDSKEMKDFFERISKQKSEKQIYDKDGNMKYPPVPVQKKEKESKDNLERDEEGNLKYPPVLVKKLDIVYSGKKNKYIVNGEDEKKQAIKFKNRKEKLEYLKNEFNKSELKEIFGDEKNIKKMAKKCDPQLLVLLSDQNMEYAKEYIKVLGNGKKAQQSELPYTMKYNLTGMRKNHKDNKLSFFQRFRINKMAKANKEVAQYVPDDKSRKWLVAPMIAALAAGGLAIANNNDKEQKAPVKEVNPISGPENMDIHKDNTMPTTPTIEQQVDQQMKNPNIKTPNIKTQDLVLGSRVNLNDGLTYAENSLGQGQTQKIGDLAWRPAGEYTIDRVALYHEGTLIDNIEAEGTNIDETVKQYAQKLGVDPSTIIQKAHVCVASGHTGPTGWINMEEMSIQDMKNNITKTYDQLQKEKANQQQQNQEQNKDLIK